MEREPIYERLLTAPGVVFLLGGIDTGKTTFALHLAERAVALGIPTAIVDADVGQSTVGPPTTVGLKFCSRPEDLSQSSLPVADALGFVGSVTPSGHLLPLVASTARLVTRARDVGSRLILVDSTGLVSGIYGQVLKYHKMDLIRPDYVVAFRRGGELDPIVGIAERFTAAAVLASAAAPEEGARSADERLAHRERAFAAYFRQGTSRWRVKPTVFMPALPPAFELSRLDRLVVGMEDGRGNCVGIGVLEYETREGILRMISPVAEGVRGLRIGSVRIDTDGRAKGSVSLRDLFGSS